MAKGRYRLERKIADGGMAEIFLGTQHGMEGFERPVVLKRILAPLLADPKFKNILIDEAHVAMGLTHSAIVQVLDLGHSHGRYYLVLELVDGWDLNQVWNRAKSAGFALPIEIALYVLAEVCRALAYAHQRTRNGKPLGIVHRDVSPHNVLLSEQGEVKLTDFGIAKALVRREQTGQGVIKGKLAFMSPEQASGAPVDARSDLFAVGTMLYLFATGRRPFEAPTDLEGILRVQKADFPAPETIAPELHPSLVALIKKVMQLRPSDRPQSAEAMLVEIEALQRNVFQPAGQTELKRWLADLEARDGVAPIARQKPDAPTTFDEIPELGDSAIVLEDSTSDATMSAADASGLHLPTIPLPRPSGAEVGAAAPGPAPTTAADRATSATRVEGKSPLPHPPAVPGVVAPQVPVSLAGETTPRESSLGRRVALVGVAGAALGGVVLMFTRRSTKDAATPKQASAPTPAPRSSTEHTTITPPATAVPSPVKPPAQPAPSPAPHNMDAGAPDADDDDREEETLLAHAEAPSDEAVIESPGDDNDNDGDHAATASHSKPGAARKTPPRPASAKTTPVVSVHIETKPEGAVIRFKDRVFGRAPMNLRFRSGTSYQLTFVKKGYVSASHKFTVSARGNQTVTTSLKKKPAPKKKGFFQRIFGR